MFISNRVRAIVYWRQHWLAEILWGSVGSPHHQVFESFLSSTRSLRIRVAQTHCLNSNFHLDDLKTVVIWIKVKPIAGKQLKTINHDIPVLPVFADARNNNTQALVTCMLCQKKLNRCINKIFIYNLKWFRSFISSQTRSKHHNYQATMCALSSQWRHLFSSVGRIWHGEINKFTAKFKCFL